jgi:hypothetical protein
LYSKEGELSEAEVDRVLTEMKTLGAYFAVITGGEPYLLKNMLMRMFRKHDDMYFLTYTNGTLLDESTVKELARAGGSEEREKTEGNDRGFMWRLNSYWRYEEVDGGLVIEGESLLLSRDIPRGLRALIGPLIDRSAREMIENTLVRIRRKFSSDALTRVY